MFEYNKKFRSVQFSIVSRVSRVLITRNTALCFANDVVLVVVVVLLLSSHRLHVGAVVRASPTTFPLGALFTYER